MPVVRRFALLGLVVLVCATAGASATQQITWEQRASMQQIIDRATALALRDGRLFALSRQVNGGNPCGSAFNALEEYDFANDVWVSRPPMQPARDIFAAAAGSDDRIYVVAGQAFGCVGDPGDEDLDSLGVVTTVQAYDPTADSWSFRHDTPDRRQQAAAVGTPDGKIYLVGGIVNDPSAPGGGRVPTSEYVYDTATDTWTPIAPLPTPRYDLAVASSGGKIYAIGGMTGGITSPGVPSDAVEVFDPATGQWAAAAPLPTARGELAAATGPDGHIYALGGTSPAARGCNCAGLTTVEEYDPASGSWSAQTPFPYLISGAGATIPQGHGLFVVGGFASWIGGGADHQETWEGALGPPPDTTPPTVSCEPATFTLNQPNASVNATVSDAESGPVAPTVSAAADTSAVGTHTVSLTGSDNAGNTTTLNCAYRIIYAFNGFLAPVDNPPVVNTGKANKKYALKWQLQDANAAYISSLSAVTSITYKSTSCAAFSDDPTDALETDTNGSGLQYDPAANQYLYHWSTPGPGCYTTFVTLNDGTSHAAFFRLT